ncbi:MAG: hypothetical protein ACC645_19695, partial [Pirellulales bacterium]
MPQPSLPPDLPLFLGLVITVTVVTLAAHAARAKITMAPLYAVAGISTMLVWQLLQLGWWVSWKGFQINAAHLGLVPALLMGMVLAYAMDGIRSARAYLSVITVTGLIAWSFAGFRDTLDKISLTTQKCR